MLVLTRKRGERIVIGKDIVITVTEIRGGSVKIGISAPEDLVIRRRDEKGEFEGKSGEWTR